jgi:predicted nucleic acid-binding protein
VFVDTGAFIALQNASDQYHEVAKAYYSYLVKKKIPLLTTNFILDEMYTWLLREKGFGHQAAVNFGKWVVEVGYEVALEATVGKGKKRDTARLVQIGGWVGKQLAVFHVTSKVEKEAWRIFEEHEHSGFTYTDCVSFATMRLLSLRQAFVFDTHFEQMGFLSLPELP